MVCILTQGLFSLAYLEKLSTYECGFDPLFNILVEIRNENNMHSFVEGGTLRVIL